MKEELELDALRKYRGTLPAVFKFKRQDAAARNESDGMSTRLEPEATNEITVCLDPDIDERLTRLVKEYGHNKQYYLVELARNGIEALEDALEDIMRKYDIQN